MGRDLLALLDQLVAGLEEGLARNQRRLRAARAAAHLELVGIALQQLEALERDAELVAQHLGEGRGVALAVVERAAQHGDRAVGLAACCAPHSPACACRSPASRRPTAPCRARL